MVVLIWSDGSMTDLWCLYLYRYGLKCLGSGILPRTLCFPSLPSKGLVLGRDGAGPIRRYLQNPGSRMYHELVYGPYS